jgi:hypothetical protein
MPEPGQPIIQCSLDTTNVAYTTFHGCEMKSTASNLKYDQNMNRSRHHYFRFFAFVSLLAALFVGATAAQADTCPLYPLTFPGQMFTNVPTNTVVIDVFNGVLSENFSWVTWTGDLSQPTLVASMVPPGNSTNYVNPDNSTDHEVNIGDWIVGRPGVPNSIDLRDALDNLHDVDLIVPIFDQVRGTEDAPAYHVSGFATIRIIGYHLPNKNRISVLFLGFTDCSTGGPGGGGPGV